MALNKEKITATALKYLQKGQIDKAAREYEKILEVDPTDEHALHKVGDLYLRMNRKQEALNMYNRVSDLYVRQGFYLKAIAVYKQILNIDPKRLELHIKMAEMYNQLGLLSETVNQYQYVARRYEEEQRHVEALDILRQVTRLDPDNLPNKIKLAEGLIKHGKPEEGIETYSAMMKDLERLKKEDEYLRVAERYLQHNPADHAVSCKLAGIYQVRAEYKKSLHVLQNTLRLDHNNIDALQLFAEGFISLKQFGKAVTVFKEMVQLLKRNRSERKKLEWVLERIISIDPEEQDSRKLLEELQKRPEAKSVTPVAAELPADDYVKPSKRVSHPEETSSDVSKAEKSKKSKEEAKLPVDIDRLLTEGEIFIKYGLLDKAAERLEAIIEIEECDSSALERIKKFCIALGKPEIAARQLLIEAGRLLEKGQMDQALTLVEECLTLQVNVEKVREIGRLISSGNVTELRRAIARFLSGSPFAIATETIALETAPVQEVEILEVGIDEEGVEELEELEALEELEELSPEEESNYEESLLEPTDPLPPDREEMEFIPYMEGNEVSGDAGIEAEYTDKDEVEEIELDDLEDAEQRESEEVLTVEKQTAASNIEEVNDQSSSDLELDFESHNYRQESIEGKTVKSPGTIKVAEPHVYEHVEKLKSTFRPAKPLVKEAIELLVSDAVQEKKSKTVAAENVEDDDNGFEVLDEIVVYKDKERTDSVPLKEEPVEEIPAKVEIVESEEVSFEENTPADEQIADEQLNFETVAETLEPKIEAETVEIEIPPSQANEAEIVDYSFDVESAVEHEIMQQAEEAASQQNSATEQAQIKVEEIAVSYDEALEEVSSQTLEETAELEILEEVPIAEAKADDLAFEEDLDAQTLEILEETVVDFDEKALENAVELPPEKPTVSPMDSFDQELFAALEKSSDQENDAISEMEEPIDKSVEVESLALNDSTSIDLTEDATEEVSDDELDEMLEEANFFLTQGLFEEAIEIYEELSGSHPQNKKIEDLLARAWELFDISTSSTSEEKSADDSIGALADDLLQSEPCDDGGNFEVLEEVSAHSVPPELPKTPRVLDGGPEEDDSVKLADEVFAGLEDGQELKLHSRGGSSGSNAMVDVDGIKTHYKLGVAYKEMGLLNEAIAEFNLASDGGLFFDANAMLGACYLQKKMNLKAAAYLKKLIKHPEMTRSRLMELRYDVARTYEDSGDLDLALRYYVKIRAIDPTYEDAAARVEAFEEQGIIAADQTDNIEKILEQAEKNIPPDIDSFGRGGSSDGNVGYI